MFTIGETYRELCDDYFTRRDPERITKRLVAELQELEHHVTLNQLLLGPDVFRSEHTLWACHVLTIGPT